MDITITLTEEEARVVLNAPKYAAILFELAFNAPKKLEQHIDSIEDREDRYHEGYYDAIAAYADLLKDELDAFAIHPDELAM